MRKAARFPTAFLIPGLLRDAIRSLFPFVLCRFNRQPHLLRNRPAEKSADAVILSVASLGDLRDLAPSLLRRCPMRDGGDLTESKSRAS
jgi:hypothetical protein